MSAARPPLLAPLAFPLQEHALVEASAGTGKTFTIAALYLRLVLGHGGDAAFERPLTPPEILVVTFTEAATQELRDRIRARLAEAADAFGADPATVPGSAPGEDLLHALRASYPPAEWPACAHRLRLAAEWMDEAAVSTIHGWCNRMLREHAFDSGSLFTQTLEADLGELQAEAVRDYWRTFFYPLPAGDAACVRGWWGTPALLQQALERLLPDPLVLPAAPAPAVSLAAARTHAANELSRLKAPWARWADELEAAIDAAVAARQVNGTRLQKRFYGSWLQCLRTWAANEETWPLPPGSTAWQRLTPAGIADAWKSGTPLDHPALHAMAALPDALAQLSDGREQVLAHAARWVAGRVGHEQRRRAQMGFDDLLTRLHAALHDDGNGARLAALVRAQFPVALIDEFQDTDPVQYGIFRRIYRDEDVAASGAAALVLIGDPKQAIYAFRGADIHTYLAARRDTEGHHHTLGTNFRSTAAMVHAVNHVFGSAERREGAGAFRFRTAGADPLPFFDVGAKGREERFEVAGAPVAALTCWWHDDGRPVKAGEYRTLMAQGCAAQIVQLLRQGQQGTAGFRTAEGLQPLRPRDIAVLVNGRTEALAVREALAEAGVRTVYLSDRETVFDSPAAAELQRLLQACAEPEDARRVRAALGTGLLALDWTELERLVRDEVYWEQRVEQFHGYRRQWRQHGVLPMLRRLLHDFDVPARLLAAGDERQLTDLLHLAELLQHASALLHGEHALVRHLAEQREERRVGAEDRQVRLESDADLLKVVTVHKSKGLEYPLVFLPFPCACWPVDGQSLPVKWHDAEGQPQVSLRPDASAIAQADQERLGEDLRKLYVALTRARHAAWIGVAPTEHWSATGMGYLLGGGAALEPGGLQPLLAATLGPCEGIAIEAVPAATGERLPASAAPAQLAPEPRLAQASREHWWIASYSRLLVEQGGTAAPQSALEANYLEAASSPPDTTPEAPPAAPSPVGSLHAVPRGAAAGTFLHGLLESAGRHGFAALAADVRERDTLVSRRCTAAWRPHEPLLRDWLAAFLDTPWDLSPLAADAAGPEVVAPAGLRTYQVEMEFWLPAERVDTTALDRAVTARTLGGQARPALAATQVNGMLKGFIDLVFEHEGRYFVADYKSNWLGESDRHYTAAAMAAEVLRHRYDLQYALYLFALHRLLRARLPAYDYDRHVGGAVYLFLRGHASPTGGLHLERPPRELMDTLDALFAGGEGAA